MTDAQQLADEIRDEASRLMDQASVLYTVAALLDGTHTDPEAGIEKVRTARERP